MSRDNVHRPHTAMSLSFLLILGTVLGVASPIPVAAQSAGEILTRAMDAHEERLAGVDDLVIQQDIMGFSTVTYMVKEEVDGRAILRTRSALAGDMAVDGNEMDPGELAGEIWADPWGVYHEALDRWQVEGQGSVDGHSTWRLSLEDFQGMDWNASIPGEDAPFNPSRLVMELDEERLIPLALEVEGEVVEGQQVRPVALQMRFSDYREVEGYLHPFLTTMDLDMASMGMSPQEAEQARTGMDQLREQLEQIPEAQRQMMEEMLGDQLRALEGMLSGEAIQVELRVTDLQVNGGPPNE
jgi:hypothetical protein